MPFSVQDQPTHSNSLVSCHSQFKTSLRIQTVWSGSTMSTILMQGFCCHIREQSSFSPV
ncbi:hypothetical protein DPMN_167257 [Dreissena polymorpha]|uniref:Uncharacterized protein n=1 Tax=Dreissena polymorpha TaxID=45954 RepID=A0A9D4F125_DREPO|nr:hypothetical protein DPMN_167257 [Dreissena polymorpha]